MGTDPGQALRWAPHTVGDASSRAEGGEQAVRTPPLAHKYLSPEFRADGQGPGL